MSDEVNATTFQLKSPDGIDVFVRKWVQTGSAPQAVVLVIHGAAEHSARYDRLARILAGQGYAVYAPDHRGHGQTAANLENAGWAGPDGWSGILNDIHQLAGQAASENPGLPVFILGHSMGSFLTQNYIELYGNELAGVILTGSTGALAGADQMLPFLQGAATADARQPSAAFAQMFVGFNAPFPPKTGFEWLSRDEAEVQKYVDDPWSGFGFSNQLVYDMFNGMLEMWKPENEARVPKDLPILIASGSHDPVGGENSEGVKALADRYRAQGIKDVELVLYPEARHEILNETNRDEVHGLITGWLAKHLPVKA